MGLETGTYIDDLVVTNPVGSTDPKSQGDNHLRLIKSVLKSTFPGMAGRAWRVQAKTGAYTVLATDNMSVILVTSGTFTLTWTAAATLGNGHVVLVVNNSTGVVTIDPNGSETINGAATLGLAAYEIAWVYCDGSNLYAVQNYRDADVLLRATALYGAASGTDTYTVTIDSITELTDGLVYAILIPNANTSATVTIDINSFGATTVKRDDDGSNPHVGDLGNKIHLFMYDGTYLRLMNPLLQASDINLPGNPTTTTQAAGNNSTRIATTEFVQNAITGSETCSGLHVFGFTDMPQNSTRYFGGLGAGKSSTESDFQCIFGRAVRIKNLRAAAAAAPPSGQTFDITIRKNGADTAETVQLTNADYVVADTTNTVDFRATDVFSMKCVASATTGSTNDITASFQVVDQITGEGLGLFFIRGTNTNIYSYLCDFGFVRGTTGSTDSRHSFPVAQNNVRLKRVWIQSDTAIVPVTVLVNDTAEVASGATNLPPFSRYLNIARTGIVDDEVSLASEDNFLLRATGGIASHLFAAFELYKQEATAKSAVCPVFLSSAAQSQNTTRYMSGHAQSGTATESEVQVPVPAGTIKNLIALNGDAGVGGETITFNLRVNGTTQATITLTGTDVVTADLVTEVTVVADDLVSVEATTSTSTGTVDLHFAYEHFPA